MTARRPGLTPLAALALSGAAVFGPVAGSGLAQDAPVTITGRQQPSQQRTFGVSFDGGSIREYVAALRKAAGDIPVNVLISGDEEALELPEIVLEKVTVENAINALNFVRTDECVVGVNSTGHGEEEVFAVYVESRRPRGRTGGPIIKEEPAQPTSFEVFSLAQLLESPADEEGGPTADTTTLLTAIDTALEMAGAGGSTDIKFHPDSGLLIIKGDERETKLVGRLINEVYNDVTRRRVELRNLKAELSVATTELQKAEVALQAQHGELEIAQSELDQMEKLKASGMVGEGELRNARVGMKRMMGELDVAQLELEQRRHRVDALMDQIKALQARTKAPTSAEAIKAEIRRLKDRIADLEAKLAAMDSADAGTNRSGRGGR